MPEVAESPEVLTSPAETTPPASEGYAAAFASRVQAEAPAASTGDTPPPAVATPPATEKAADQVQPYGFVKDYGYETPEALKARLDAVKDYDPKTVEALKANQRDDHDKAVRQLLEEPGKAEAYFALQRIQPEALATGTPEDQHALLLEAYKVSNPELTGRMAELAFKKEFAAKYSLMDSDDPDDAEEAELAKLQYEADLKKAAPVVKGAQEAAKVALLPQAEAQGPTPAEREARVADWLKNVDAVIAAPIEQTVQVDGKPVKVAYDSKDAGLKAALDDPDTFFLSIIYPNGPDKPADPAAIARAYGGIKQLDAVAKAVAEHTRAAIGAHKTLADLTNPAPDAPQVVPGSAGSYQDAFANARPVR